MAEKLPMLALSPTMEEGVIVKWHVKEGDSIASGDVICEVETDKAVMEYTTNSEGTLLKIVVGEGAKAAIAETIAVVGEAGEDIASLLTEPAKPAAKPQAPKPSEPVAAPPAVPQPSPPSQAASGSKLRSTPIARKIADKHELDLTRIQGTGPQGRVTKRDVQKAIENKLRTVASVPGAQMAADDLDAVAMPVSPKRKIIAQRLFESKYNSPHFYVKLTVVMDELLRARQELNQRRKNKVSFNAFLMKFVAQSLKRHPMINATWMEDKIIKHGRVDIGLAVALEDGLITPIVRDCAKKGILQIDEELQGLIAKARAEKLMPDEYLNSTFCISNLGSYGVDEFSAIINPPNSAILALGATVRTPFVVENDEIEIRSAMAMTLSCDHRVIDGTVAAEFLTDLKGMLEYPVQSLY
jgi:pyruvate dehydrogenase E2 component (dihydrolipoamide acetyltransferase)